MLFRSLWQEAAQYGGRVMAISANSWLTGQPNRIAAFRKALEIVCSHPGVWPTTYGAMLAAYRALAGGGGPRGPLRPWLFRIAHNECMDLLRARPRAAELTEAPIRSRASSRSASPRTRSR